MTFVVPRPSSACRTTNLVAVWVGLGGNGAKFYPFTQNGISVTQTGVGAWLQWFDASGRTVETDIPAKDFSVRFGDTVTLAETWNPGHTSVSFVWHNLSTTRYHVVTLRLGRSRFPAGAAADWVVERLDNGAMPMFGSVHAWNARATQASNTLDSHGAPRIISSVAARPTSSRITMLSSESGAGIVSTVPGRRLGQASSRGISAPAAEHRAVPINDLLQMDESVRACPW